MHYRGMKARIKNPINIYLSVPTGLRTESLAMNSWLEELQGE